MRAFDGTAGYFTVLSIPNFPVLQQSQPDRCYCLRRIALNKRLPKIAEALAVDEHEPCAAEVPGSVRHTAVPVGGGVGVHAP